MKDFASQRLYKEGVLNKNKVVVKHARSDDQKRVLKGIVEDDVCPFCQENLAKYHKNPIVIDGKHWLVTENQWPYDNAVLQILIIAKRHVETVSDLTAEEWHDWTNMLSDAVERYGITSGAVCMRFGNPIESGASVLHLHSQIIVSDPNAKDPVRYKIGSRKK